MDRLTFEETQVMDRLRGALLTAPAPEVAAAHLASMAAAAESVAGAAGVEERGNAMRAFTGRRGVALAAAAALALGAGLAAAVTLPDEASERAEEVQAEKAAGTNGQDDGPSVQSSTHGDAVSAVAQDDSNRGCEHGRAVSDVASSKSADNRSSDGPKGDPCEKNEKAGAKGAGGKAWGHGDPPGKRVGQTKPARVAPVKDKPAKAGGAGHGRGGSKSDDSTADTTGATDGTSEGGTTTAPAPSPEPSPTPSIEVSPAA
ncbi:MAG TPA: hypothetical protein VG602_09230 [Actinomycetota bacterium]|nr:hypothetical protein [Actinomycetota bacterium]